MSVNTAHANNGVLIHAGECILLFSDNVSMEFSGQSGPLFKGTKVGRCYLTTHRMIFNNNKSSDPMQSFSFPFVSINDVEVEQPVFGANYIKGKVRAQENGNFVGEAKFKLLFKAGGAIDFAQAMLRAVQMARRHYHHDAPPPYEAPTGDWYAAPPPAYTPNPTGYYGWVPQSAAFPNQPPQDSVFMTPNPPPYPGIAPPTNGGAGGFGYPPQQQHNGYPGAPMGTPGGYPGGTPGYPGAPPNAGYPGQAPQGNYPGGGGGYQPQGMGWQTGPGYQQPSAPGGGYPAAPGGGYPSAPGGGYPSAPGGGYPSAPGAMGFSTPQQQPPQNSKEAEAAQSAYYDPNQPQTAYVPPPPAYYEQPPSYNSIAKKHQ
ncbi:WW domain-binding protein 2 [Lutzomyia longipalpis]|uniref:Vacuolar protein-sorting-associated protein 36 n=1 Tax=Lutzomyia longipalpis TaxID=7200 RepID=A0A1B0GJG2_LUTLO|nr:WW domain-binding protein 2 [Lutzomyia longipalpis]